MKKKGADDDSGGADDYPKPSADLTHQRVVKEGDKLKVAPTGRDKGELLAHETVHTIQQRKLKPGRVKGQKRQVRAKQKGQVQFDEGYYSRVSERLRHKRQVQFGEGLSGPKPRGESRSWTDYNVHDPGVVQEGDKLKGAPTGRAKLKWSRENGATILIIVALIATCATLGFLYVQESNKLEDAQQALNTYIEKNTGLQAEVNSLQRDILASEAEVATLSESLDVAKAAIRNIKE